VIGWTRLAGKGFEEPPPTATRAILVTRLSDWTLAGPAGNPLHSLEESELAGWRDAAPKRVRRVSRR